MMPRTARECTGRLAPGQDLIVAGFAGYAGTIKLLHECRAELEMHFSSGWLDLSSGAKNSAGECPAAFFLEMGATECEPAGQGGILAALWRLSCGTGIGAEIYLREIPMLQSTVEICEYFSLNPFCLWSQGTFILAAENGGRLVRALRARGVAAGVAGGFLNGRTCLVHAGEATGYLTRPYADELQKKIPDLSFEKGFI